VTIDEMNRLHVVWWGGFNNFWYSRAWAEDAGSVRAWATPRVLDGPASTSTIVAQGTDTLHVLLGGTGARPDIYYRRSDDGGETWTPPINLSQIDEPNTIAILPQLAIDARGRLHAVWVQIPDPPIEYLKSGIFYSRSLDGGQSWSNPLSLDLFDEARYRGGYGPHFPSIAAIGDGEIHVVWNGPPLGQRATRRSTDGGETWEAQQAIFEAGFRGMTGVNRMIVDATGKIHLVSAGFSESHSGLLLYTSWNGSSWRAPLQVNPLGPGGENPILTLSNGNRLELIWWDGHGVQHTSRLIEAPYVPPQAVSRPTPTPTLTEETTSQPVMPPTPTATRAAIENQSAPPPGYASAGDAVIAGVIPALALIGSVLMIRLLQRKHL